MIFGNVFPLSLILTILYFSKCSKHCKKDLEDSSTGQAYGVDKNGRYVFVVSGVGGEDDGYMGKIMGWM